MLILTRKLGETLRIGDDIAVTIIETKGSQVRVGVEALVNVSAHREEVYERIKDEEAA